VVEVTGFELCLQICVLSPVVHVRVDNVPEADRRQSRKPIKQAQKISMPVVEHRDAPTVALRPDHLQREVACGRVAPVLKLIQDAHVRISVGRVVAPVVRSQILERAAAGVPKDGV
jgi:hypothetical protein